MDCIQTTSYQMTLMRRLITVVVLANGWGWCPSVTRGQTLENPPFENPPFANPDRSPVDGAWSATSAGPVVTPGAELCGDDPGHAKKATVRFQWVDGRLQLDPPRHKKGVRRRGTAAAVCQTDNTAEPSDAKPSVAAPSDAESTFAEQWTVSARDGLPSLHYEYRDARYRCVMDVTDARKLQLTMTDQVRGLRTSIDQPAIGPIGFRVETAAATANEPQRWHRADVQHWPTFLHWYHGGHPLARQMLQPLLDELMADQPLYELVDRVDGYLMRERQRRSSVSVEAFDELLRQLDNDDRYVRVNARRRLGAVGVSLMPHIRRSDGRRLSPNQSAVLEQLDRLWSHHIADRPATLAARLAGDPDYPPEMMRTQTPSAYVDHR